MAMELTVAGRTSDYEDRLAARSKEGDKTAFDELVTRYQHRLYRFALRALEDESDAEDVVQATFVRAFRGIGAYRPGGFFSSWVYRIALNECRRKLRHRRRAPGGPLSDVAQVSADPQNAVVARDRHRMVRDAVLGLPALYRDAMMLFYFEDMSVEEVSRALNVSVSAVKVRLHRARRRLSVALKGALL